MLSALADRGVATQRVVTGTVAEIHAGEWMLITNEAMRVPVALGRTTAIERQGHYAALDPEIIKPGARVTVWYRSVAERRPVADKVRVLRVEPAISEEPRSSSRRR
ncbi:MAG: hypothetical protein ACRD2N_11275 [Vicinamibacterales bacterium]